MQPMLVILTSKNHFKRALKRLVKEQVQQMFVVMADLTENESTKWQFECKHKVKLFDRFVTSASMDYQ
jgi:hypothetical protein